MSHRPQQSRLPIPISFALRRVVSAVVFCCAAASLKGENWEGAEVSKTKVHENPATSKFVSVSFSATREGCRAAALVGGLVDGFTVIVDGKKGPRYEDIREETPVFSPNGLALAYCARKDGKWRWVINGIEEPIFGKLTPTSFTFSADGKRHAYVARPGFRRNVLVVDGKVVAGGEIGKPIPFDAAPAFSPDGSRLAYVEEMVGDRTERVNLDGKPGAWTSGIGRRLSMGFGADPVDGGISNRPRPAVFSWAFSADSKHFAYTEFVGKRRRKVIDGVTTPLYEKIGVDFAFAPDGSDYAYMIADSEGQLSIVRSEGKPMPIDSIADGTLTFSPNGKRLAFGGMRDGRDAAWVDGKAAPVNMPASNHSALHFSPDSKRIAYSVNGKGSSDWHWVVDGKAGVGARTNDRFDFSPDSAHYCYLLPVEGGRIGIVVDGELRASHPQVQVATFRTDGSLEYFASDEDRQLFRFRVTGF
jgi:hypothetical protein